MADAGNASDATQQNAMMQALMQQGGNQSLYTPPELSASGIAGTGGYVSQPSQYISGMEAGSNLFNNWEASQRGRIAFGEEQTANVGAMAAMQRGGVVPPVRSPRARVQAIPVPTQSQVPMNGPYGQGSPAAMQRGGVVARPARVDRSIPPTFLASPASRFSGVNGSHQAIPGISGYDQGGVVEPNDPSGVQSAIAANPGAPALPGASLASGAVSAMPTDTQTVVPPQGVAPGAGALAPQAASPADDQTVVPPQAGPQSISQAGAQQSFVGKVEDFAGYIHARALNDDGVPNHAAGGIPTPAGAPAGQSVKGTPAQYDVTGKVSPHSLPADFWDQTDDKIMMASRFAALAGRNPAVTYASLNAIRTSYVQGHMLRWLSVASRAQLDGNTDEMVQALRNANYYLPDGKNLEVNKNASGQVTFQDPIYPYVDSRGQRFMYQAPGTTPNVIPVNQEYIQLVGESLLNPMNVQNMIMGSRAAMVKQQQETMQAQGSYLTGQGRAQWGAAAATRASADASRVPAQNYRDLAQADLDRARASSSQFALRFLQGLKLDPAAAKAVTDAANGIDGLALGPPQQVPVTDSSGNPSLSPAAGKVIHDTSRADPALARAPVQDIAVVKSWAAGLVAANPRGMTPQFADSVASAAYARSKQTHRGPDGKPQSDVMVDRTRGMLHVWDAKGKRWNNFPMSQGAAMPMGSVPLGLFQMAAGGSSMGSAIPPEQSGGMDFSNPPAGLFGGDGSSASP